MILVACECSGVVRDALIARGIAAMSCDIKPTERPGPHHQGDVRPLLANARRDFGGIIAFPDCTYLTCSAEWAYGDGPYHMNLKPGTLTGAARRAAREEAIAFVEAIWNAHDRVIIENPVGVLSDVLGKPQVIQPHMFGDDASKATCIWIKGWPKLTVPPRDRWHAPRMVNGKPRWGNQTDGGQNKLPPGPSRAADRARTYPGIGRAIADVVAMESVA